MDIKELESFKLSDAIKFHDKLNPRIWSQGKLRPEVKKQLEIIAEDFITELGISGLNVEDITLSGSNAAYTYTPNSDLDLHILVDMNKLDNDEVYRELFQAKKTLYNDTHDIKIHGVPVELYVQDTNEPVKSLGEYSLLRDEWIKIPKKRKAEFDQQATRLKYEKLESLIHNAMKSKKAEKIDELLKTIKRYRQAGLDKAGEFSAENLAYKALRNKGYIQKLYDLRNILHTRELSIEETKIDDITEVNSPGELSVDPGLIKRFTDKGWQIDGEGRDQIVMSKPSSNTVLKIVGQGSDIRQDVVRRYVNFFRANQRNPHFPRVGLDKTLRWNGKTYYVYTQERLYSLPGDEAVMDYLEQTMQRLSRAEEPDYDTMPAALTAEQVYGLARAVDRLYGTGEADPHEFDLGNLANIMQRANGQLVIVDPLSDFMDDVTENFIAEEAWLDQLVKDLKDKDNDKTYKLESASDNSITLNQLYDGNYPDRDELFWDYVRPNELNRPLKVKVLPKHRIRIMLASQYRVEHLDELFDMMDDEQKDYIGAYTKDPKLSDKIIVISGDKIIDGNHRALAAALKNVPINYVDLVDLEDEDLQESASGYIPSEKQKNDPRFSNALTIDVKPNSIKKNAKAFGFNVSRAGIPPLLRK